MLTITAMNFAQEQLKIAKIWKAREVRVTDDDITPHNSS